VNSEVWGVTHLCGGSTSLLGNPRDIVGKLSTKFQLTVTRRMAEVDCLISFNFNICVSPTLKRHKNGERKQPLVMRTHTHFQAKGTEKIKSENR
jgi:hypothetical protein